MANILVGVSGGVDSSLAAAILKNDGSLVSGGTLSLFANACLEDLKDAAAVCENLGIKHLVFDLSQEFKKDVMAEFCDSYLRGETPNPCIVCNKFIKFGKMLDIALENGFTHIATGHYARIEKQGERYLLLRAKDLKKDQSYMLYTLSQHQLSHSLFPLGEFTKEQVRAKAEEWGLITSHKKDSQDICFVSDGNYAEFIKNFTGSLPPQGDFCDINGSVLGRHKGIIHYTNGQRKGLGIALGKPAFVIAKDAKNNRVVLGDEEHLFSKRVAVKNVNYIPFDELNDSIKVTAKLRYRHEAQPAVLHPHQNGALLEFDAPQRAATSGQAAVFYDGDTVIGGGTIE